MTNDLQPYPEYKESGHHWLGDVPAHWDTTSLGAISLRRSERNRPDLPLLSVLREKGVVLRSSLGEHENHNFIPDDLSNYRVAHMGDLVVNKMKAWQGSVGIAPTDGIVSPAYYVFQLSGITREYAHRLLRSRLYADYFARASDGVRIGQWDLSTDQMKRIAVVIPPIQEQSEIVRYLDVIDQRIYRFIRNRRRLIKVLNEQKQAIFNRAVTRGLNSDATLKPTDINWLGKIPEHWLVLPVRRLSTFITSGPRGWSSLISDEGDLFLQSGNLGRGMELKLDGVNRLRPPGGAETKRTEVRRDDILICVTGALTGNVAHVATELPPAYVNQHVALVRPDRGIIIPRYLAYVLHSQCGRIQFKNAEYGGTKQGLSLGDVASALSTVPPLAEQEAIIHLLDNESQKILKAIATATREIDLIREYRTRLIADVVTGKVDVRHAAAVDAVKQTKKSANVYFQRSVFAAEIVHRLHEEPTFGHVKFEKLIFLCEKSCGVDTGSTYRRKAAGPYDNRALRSIDSQIKKQKWYEAQKREKGYRYIPLEKAGGHREYFDRYFADAAIRFNEIIETFRNFNTQRCEIVATLYSAWDDLLSGGNVSDDQIIEQVLHHWHPSKKIIEEDRWRRALKWMKDVRLTPLT